MYNMCTYAMPQGRAALRATAAVSVSVSKTKRKNWHKFKNDFYAILRQTT